MNRVSSERRANGALFEVLDGSRQGTGAQDHREILGLLLGERTGDAAGVADGFLDVGDLLHLAVEHDGQRLADVVGGELVEAVTAIAGQGEDHVGTATLFASGLSRAQIAPADGRDAADEVVDVAAFAAVLAADALALDDDRVGAEECHRGRRAASCSLP